MRESILIVVSAIVILVIALVLLAIFSYIIPNIYTITGAQSQCAQTGRTTCASTGTLPGTWAVPTYRVDEGGNTVTRSCAYLMQSTCGTDLSKHTCYTCNYPTP